MFTTKMKPYEGSGDSQQSPYEPGRMDNDEHLKIFLQSVRRSRSGVIRLVKV